MCWLIIFALVHFCDFYSMLLLQVVDHHHTLTVWIRYVHCTLLVYKVGVVWLFQSLHLLNVCENMSDWAQSDYHDLKMV